jgi:hypothetical protein
MKSHNSDQCKNKWNSLKTKYMKKKDNQSSKFAYFSEFDEIFAKEHNVTPVSVASYSKRTRKCDQ